MYKSKRIGKYFYTIRYRKWPNSTDDDARWRIWRYYFFIFPFPTGHGGYENIRKNSSESEIETKVLKTHNAARGKIRQLSNLFDSTRRYAKKIINDRSFYVIERLKE